MVIDCLPRAAQWLQVRLHKEMMEGASNPSTPVPVANRRQDISMRKASGTPAPWRWQGSTRRSR